jgi:LysR family transcriptional activator of dmlA
LEDLRLFRIAARRGSFAATANELGTSGAFVSKRIAILEKRLHVKLFHRTTRRVAVTEEGETIYAWAQKLSDDMDQMMEAVAATKSGPQGLLRISTSFGLGRNYIAPVLSELRRRYPALEIRLDLFDRVVDLVDEGIDLDIRVGEVPEPNLIAHRIVEQSNPVRIARLSRKHVSPGCWRILRSTPARNSRTRSQFWRVAPLCPSGLETVKVSGPMASNHGDIVRTWAIEGHGIMLRAIWDVAENLENGELIRVLPAYRQSAEVWAVSPVRLSSSGKVRVCVRFLQEQLQHGEFALPGLHSE